MGRDMNTFYENQQEELKTIRERTLTLRLSDADVKRICKKAGSVGLTVSELIENFIGDLVCGTYSNGSDERNYADNWFERCCFDLAANPTFLRYSLSNYFFEDVIELYNDIQEEKEYLADLETAPMQEDKLEEKAAIEENIKFLNEQLQEYFNEYRKSWKMNRTSLEKEMKIILEWYQQYENLLGS